MASLAIPAESEKSRFSIRQDVDVGVRVALPAIDLEMPAGQLEVQTAMVELLGLRDPRQGKTLPIDHAEARAVVF